MHQLAQDNNVKRGSTHAGERNASVELYRIVLMFGIVLLHSGYCSGGSFYWVNSIAKWCVDGFVFITGFYGCRFSVSKLVRLYGTGIFCGLVIETFVECWWGTCALSSVIKGAWRHFCGCWFLHAYALMLCLAPAMNFVCEGMKRENRSGFRALYESPSVRAVFPFLVAVFGWGLMTRLPFLHRVMPNTPGLQPYSGLTLLGVYLIARMYRLFELGKAIRWCHLLIAAPLLTGVCIAGYGWLGDYNSPFAVLQAIAIFEMFRRIRLPSAIGRVVFLIAPSVFAIYMLHGHPSCFQWLTDQIAVLRQSEIPQWAACVLASTGLFFFSFVLDIPRRVLGRIIDAGWRRIVT